MRRYEYGPLHCLSKWVLQQRHAAARSTVPSRKSVTEAVIQLLSPVLGSVAVVVVAVLGLVVLATVVLVTVVDVLVVVAAGFSAGFAVGPVVSSPAAGLASAGDLLELSPGTLSPSVSPAGGVATSGSITTCGATAPEASTTPLAPKVPPAGATKRADCVSSRGFEQKEHRKLSSLSIGSAHAF